MAASPAARPLRLEERRWDVPVFEVTVGDKRYRVEVPDPYSDPMQIVVDGEAFVVDIAPGDGTALSERPEGEGSFDPAGPPTSEHPIAVPRPAPRRCSNSILAPMPGTVLSIPVRMGQKVAPGDVLCVLEAMKMKNPLFANQEGKVAEIAVKLGQAVAYGDLLVRLA